DIDIEIERKLQDDDRATVGTGGGHLAETRDLTELTLERSGDGRRHDIGIGAGIKGDDLNGWVIDFRQRRNRKLFVRNDTREHDRTHQKRCGYRPQNKWTRRIH